MNKQVLLIGHSGDMYGASRSLAKLARILDKEHHVFVMLPERGPLYDVLATIIPADRILLYPDLYIFTRKSFKLKFIPGTAIKFVKNVAAIRNIIRQHQ